MKVLSNSDMAAVFEEMADLLALQGGEPHRVRAFRRTAAVLQNLPEAVGQVLRQGRLPRVRGLGEGSIHRIKELLRTGSCQDQRRLRAALPVGLRELLKLRGLGPSKIRLLHQHLGIASVEQLEYAARSGLLARLPRMGERSVEQLLDAIEDHRRRAQRLPLKRALEIGGVVVEGLLRSPSVQRADLVGSGRRRKETVGDVDFIAASDDPVATVAQFCTLDPIAEVLARGASQCSGRLATGQQVDLWVFRPREYGAGLHAFSGAQPHVVGLRDRANRRGLHISEHGVFRRSDGQLLTSAEREEEVFHAVGLPFIPPELREACGEIDAAERGKLPQLVTLEELRGDLHCHTDASDGLGSARQMAEAAMAEGLEYLAITDHSKSLTVARGLDEVRVRVQLKHLRRLQDRLNGLQLLAGIEVDILPNGDLDLDPLLLRDLDWVVASVHSEMDMPASEMSSRLIRAMETGVVDCLGHPTGRRLAIREGYPLDLQRLLRAAADLDVAFELNANPGRLDLDSVACRQARDMGVWVAINSDAHSPTELQRRDIGVFVARRGWLEARHVLNAQPLRLLEDRRRARMRRSETLVAVAEQVCRGDEQRDSESVQRSRVAPGLRDQLERGAPDSDLRHRLEAYLKGASDDDPALAETLACLSDNPLQLAFDLLASSRGASEDEEWHDE